jgi:hypothetical protein
MKVAVFVSGSLKNGLESATPGEGRWGQNLSRMLAEKGHEVDVISGHYWDQPRWGNSEPVPNVTLSYIPSGLKEYDLAIYAPWEHQYRGPKWESCLTIPLRAKYFVHCTFSWGDSIKNDHTCYNNNHVLAYPYIQENNQFPTTKEANPYPTFALPLPIYRDFAPIELEKRKNIMWSTKDVFHDDWPEGHHCPRIGLATLNSIKKLRQKHEFETRFLSTRYFNKDQSKHARAYNIPELVASIPGASVHDLVPRDTLMGWMSTSRLTTIVSGLLGSFGESIASGAAPLCYSGHIYRDAARKSGILLDVFNATEDEIYAAMERLYEDDEFYLQYINDCRYEMRYYSYAESYKYFEAMCKELGLVI